MQKPAKERRRGGFASRYGKAAAERAKSRNYVAVVRARDLRSLLLSGLAKSDPDFWRELHERSTGESADPSSAAGWRSGRPGANVAENAAGLQERESLRALAGGKPFSRTRRLGPAEIEENRKSGSPQRG